MSGRAALIKLDTLWRAAEVQPPAVPPVPFLIPPRVKPASRQPHVVTKTIEQYIRQLEVEAAEARRRAAQEAEAVRQRAAEEAAAAKRRAEEEAAKRREEAAAKRAKEVERAKETASPKSTTPPAPSSPALVQTPVLTKSELMEPIEVALSPEGKQQLLQAKRIETIVKSAAYSQYLQTPEVIAVVAREAQALPKKLARTMASMAVQLTKLKQVLDTHQAPAGEALAAKIAEAIGSCAPFRFVFVNELLNSLMKAFMNQAHQLHTIWSFSHFVGLLLRDASLKSAVLPLWVYNLVSVEGGVLLCWEPVHHVKDRQNALQLYTSTLVCVPDYESLWTYVASVVNDVAETKALSSRLHILNAVVGVAHPFLLEKYGTAYTRLVDLLQNTIIPELSTGNLSADEHVQIEQLTATLSSKAKPEAYMLQEKEKALTVE